MLSTSDYSILFNKLLKGKLSPKETGLIIDWLSSEELDPAAAEMILKQLRKINSADNIDPAVLARLEERLPAILYKEKRKPARLVSILRSKWVRYAAAILILLVSSYFFLFTGKHSSEKNNIQIASEKPKDILPGKEGAVLTLVNGKTIVLDETVNGLVTIQGGSKVMIHNGRLVYDSKGSSEGQIAYNTLSTPKGRQFKLILPDGSEVWLNAASSITYPIIFRGKEREVQITGEAYFEVAKNPKMPFKVKVNNETEVEVLGTHFDINSYSNEASIRTTLLEGSVKITHQNEQALLTPGQQASINYQQANSEVKMITGKKINIINNIDVDRVMAWKNGVFNFQDLSLQEAMRQLERWYDIDVVYEKNVPQIEFYGKMGKDLSLMNVLHGLQMSKVHFRLEDDRKLVILP